MRSQAVFHASGAMGNRFQLCGVCASGTRKLHVHSDRIQDTINTVLALMTRTRKEEHPCSNLAPINLQESDWIHEVVINPYDFVIAESTPFHERGGILNGKNGVRLRFMQTNQRV